MKTRTTIHANLESFGEVFTVKPGNVGFVGEGHWVRLKQGYYQKLGDTAEITVEGHGTIVETVELERFVQVEFLDNHPMLGRPTHQLYTYRDTFAEPLQVGDLVDVPTQYLPRNRAIVRKLGANIPTGAITKAVTAVLTSHQLTYATT
jgi:hypothetical protein